MQLAWNLSHPSAVGKILEEEEEEKEMMEGEGRGKDEWEEEQGK